MASSELEPSHVFRQYATYVFAATDLVAAGGRACRSIMPLDDGTIVVKQVDGTSRTLTVIKGVIEPIYAIELTSTTVDVKVYW